MTRFKPLKRLKSSFANSSVMEDKFEQVTHLNSTKTISSNTYLPM